MVDVGISVDERDIARVSRTLDALAENTGRSMYQSIMYAANLICQSGRAASKPAVQFRRVTRNPLAAGGRVKGRDLMALTERDQRAYMIEAFSQSKGRFIIYTNDRDDKRRMVPRRGTAKNVWDIMAAKFAATKSAAFDDSTEKWQTKGERTKTDSLAVVHNKLSYLEAAYPGQTSDILNRAMSRADKAIERAVERDVEVASRG